MKSKRIFTSLYYSLPVQLFLEQLRHHPTLLLFWLFLFLVLTKAMMVEFGAYFILLEPEYHYDVNSTSMFLMGVAIGVFCLAYQLTCFILDGHKFYFLAMERRPFLKFAYNNALIPTAFWIVFLFEFKHLSDDQPDVSLWQTWGLMGMAVLGGALITVIFGFYFSYTRRDIVKELSGRVIQELVDHRVVLRKARQTLGLTRRVDLFFRTPWQFTVVPDTIRVDFRKLVRIMDQNHANAIIIQVVVAVVLASLWWLQEVPDLNFPAGVSFFLLFSFGMMTVGFISYWFRRIGPIVVILLLALLLFLNTFQPFIGKYYAYGLNYDSAPNEYSIPRLYELADAAAVREDSLNGIAMLENWKRGLETRNGPGYLPRLVMVQASGGGNRSAYWTMYCLQLIDSLTQGRLWDHTRMVTGASGGMVGASYYRELRFLALHDSSVHPDSRLYLEKVSRDLLNPIIFNVVANLFFPNRDFELDGRIYRKERGYAFEEQLIKNTGVFESRHLGDYTAPELSGRIPMLVFTPTILNDGRQLFVSAQKVSYLARQPHFPGDLATEVPGVDFQRLNAGHDPLRLRFATAIRMNATFPFVLPSVVLPTDPPVQLIDAGLGDNYGVYASCRFLYTFRDWISRNTSGVIILQLRDTEREPAENKDVKFSLYNRLFGLTATMYDAMAQSRDFLNDDIYRYTSSFLNTDFQVMELQYIPNKRYERASLNFHLTEREKTNILSAIDNEMNQAVLTHLQTLFQAPAK